MLAARAGGAVGLVGAKLVGPRDNKYHRDGSASVIPGHSLPLAGFGAMLMFAGLVAVCRGALAGGGLAADDTRCWPARPGRSRASSVSHVRYGKPDVLLLLTGLLGGAVGDRRRRPGGVLTPVWAIVIGAVAGVLVPLAAVELDLRLRVDDPTGAVAIHLVGGAWGTLAAGCSSAGPTFGDVVKGLGAQVLGLGRRRWPSPAGWRSPRSSCSAAACGRPRPTSSTASTWPSTTSGPTPTSSRTRSSRYHLREA